MFRKGVITDEISRDLKVAAELASRYGLDGIGVGYFSYMGYEATEECLIQRDRLMKKVVD